MVWENVPGAFSSNKGEDFRAVLEETAKVVCEDAIIPRPTGGKWSPSGCIMGDGWSIAWRVHDAQFWGVPQRRKRIALVADFGGESAPEILFERESLCGDIEESRKEGQEAPGTIRGDIEETISFQERAGCDGGARESSYSMSEQEPCPQSTIKQYCLNNQGGSVMGVSEDVTGALRAQEHGHQPIVYGISSYESNAMKSGNPHSGIYEANTSRTLDLNGGSPACNQGGMVVLEGNGSRPSHQGDGYRESEVSYTLNSTEQHAVCYESIEGGAEPITASKAGFFLNARNNGKADTLVATDYKDPQVICYGLDRASFNQGQNAQYDFSVTEEQAQTLVAKGPGGY